jgi:hypothetical protein
VATHGARPGDVVAVAAERDAQGRPRTTSAHLRLRRA